MNPHSDYRLMINLCWFTDVGQWITLGSGVNRLGKK